MISFRRLAELDRKNMSNNPIDTASDLIDRFEQEADLKPVEAEKLVSSIFRACGHDVTDSGFVEGPDSVDCYFQTMLDGKLQRVGVEVKMHSRPVDTAAINQLQNLKTKGDFDRGILVARSGFSERAVQKAEAEGLGEIDLFDPSDLRNWLAKHSPDKNSRINAVNIIREAMKAVALQIAKNPVELATLEWRQLEHLLREVFEGLGYGTTLTRPGKDGGFDLELEINTDTGKEFHLIEVKHWAEQKPGASHLKKLVKVTAQKMASGGLLLSTSGFTKTIYSGMIEFTAPVRLADGGKVISLCRAFHKLNTGFWLPDTDLDSLLYEGTKSIGE